MFKIIKYCFLDLIRSRWIYYYAAFYLILTACLFYLNTDLSKTIITLMNVVLFLVPLIASIIGLMYYYNSRDFIELLLAQPIPRSHIFVGQSIGISASLSLCIIVGIGLPFLAYGILGSAEIGNYIMLLVTGVFLSSIFSALSYLTGMVFENKLKGFGVALFIWLLFAIIYDGLLLMMLVHFNDYPLEKLALITTLLNPIDLSRVLILLQLDIAALMGYTGAVFERFLGNAGGHLMAISSLFIWVSSITWFIYKKGMVKDF